MRKRSDLQGSLIEGDSLTVIKKLQSETRDKSILSPIIADIKSLLKYFRSITFHHVRREANEAAHALAQFGSNSDEERVWIEKASKQSEHLLAMDWSKFCLSS